MSFTSSANVETSGYPETAVPKHIMYGKTKFGAKSVRLPRITLCPASFYGCDPITLYEPPKSALARFSQYLCSPFRRHPKVDLGASYDSFSKPPAWMKNEERDSVYEQRVQGPKHHRRRSAVAFCLGFFLASASMIIIIGAVLAHKRLRRQDEIAAATDNEHISSVRRQLDVYGVDAKNTSANNSVDLFNSVVNTNNSVPQHIWMQVDNAYPALATKLNGPILEIEPKAMRPIFDAAVPYNVLPWSILKLADTDSMCFLLRNPKKDKAITVKITRLHHSSQSKGILVDRSAFIALAIDSNSFNTTVNVTAEVCKDIPIP